MLGTRSVLQIEPYMKLNKRHSWAEAEVFVFAKLRAGFHPEYISYLIAETAALFPLDPYSYDVLCASATMLKNLFSRGLFADLPAYSTYYAFTDSQHPIALEQLCHYKSLMAIRFGNFWLFSRLVLDPFAEATLSMLTSSAQDRAFANMIFRCIASNGRLVCSNRRVLKTEVRRPHAIRASTSDPHGHSDRDPDSLHRCITTSLTNVDHFRHKHKYS